MLGPSTHILAVGRALNWLRILGSISVQRNSQPIARVLILLHRDCWFRHRIMIHLARDDIDILDAEHRLPRVKTRSQNVKELRISVCHPQHHSIDVHDKSQLALPDGQQKMCGNVPGREPEVGHVHTLIVYRLRGSRE